MAYQGIDRERFAELLRLGADDNELREFFRTCRLQLIQKGGKVQNLPHGNPARIRTLAQLPETADRIIQKWFSENLTMVDPEPPEKLVGTLREYEAAGESLPESDAKRISRSCLVHVFAAEPPKDLMEFLRAPLGGRRGEHIKDVDVAANDSSRADEVLSALAPAIVDLLEGKDPDEHLSALGPAIGAFISGLYAACQGEDVEEYIEGFSGYPDIQGILKKYLEQGCAKKWESGSEMRGVQVSKLPSKEAVAPDYNFDYEADEIIGLCIKDYPETSVFVHPFGVRTSSGKVFGLSKQEGEKYFPQSGDVIAFNGEKWPRQPRRGEIGLWHVTQNQVTSTCHRTNFHLSTEKNVVFEVRNVPFRSDEHDAVREYIKHQWKNETAHATKQGRKVAPSLLFQLQDGLIVGGAAGKDLSSEEGFESGLPSWRTLSGYSFEGRVLVLGPLPPGERYECESLAQTLRKLLRSIKDTERLTRAQQRKLFERVEEGGAHLDAARMGRLKKELAFIEEQDEALAVLLDAIQQEPRVREKIRERIDAEVAAARKQQDSLRVQIARLEKQRSEAEERAKREEREHKASIARAVKTAVEKAQNDARETLGEVLLFRSLIESGGQPMSSRATDVPSPKGLAQVRVRPLEIDPRPFGEFLRSMGIPGKHARAIEMAGEAAFASGMILLVGGRAAGLAAERWGTSQEGGAVIAECQVGLSDDEGIAALLKSGAPNVVVRDANLSPLEVYARPIVNLAQTRLIGPTGLVGTPRLILSLVDGIAALPVPDVVVSIAIRIQLDKAPSYLEPEQMKERLAEAREGEGWISQLWRPAATRLVEHLCRLDPEDAALALSVLEASSDE